MNPDSRTPAGRALARSQRHLGRLPEALSDFLLCSYAVHQELTIKLLTDTLSEAGLTEYKLRTQRHVKEAGTDQDDVRFGHAALNQAFETQDVEADRFHERLDVLKGTFAALSLVNAVRNFVHPADADNYSQVLTADELVFEARISGNLAILFPHWPPGYMKYPSGILTDAWANVMAHDAFHDDIPAFSSAIGATAIFLRACQTVEVGPLANVRDFAKSVEDRRNHSSAGGLARGMLSEGATLLSQSHNAVQRGVAFARDRAHQHLADQCLSFYGVDTKALGKPAQRFVLDNAASLADKFSFIGGPHPHEFIPAAEEFVGRVVAVDTAMRSVSPRGSSVGLA